MCFLFIIVYIFWGIYITSPYFLCITLYIFSCVYFDLLIFGILFLGIFFFSSAFLSMLSMFNWLFFITAIFASILICFSCVLVLPFISFSPDLFWSVFSGSFLDLWGFSRCVWSPPDLFFSEDLHFLFDLVCFCFLFRSGSSDRIFGSFKCQIDLFYSTPVFPRLTEWF